MRRGLKPNFKERKKPKFHKMKKILVLLFLWTFIVTSECSDITNFCSPTDDQFVFESETDLIEPVAGTTFCNCEIRATSPWSTQSVVIECRDLAMNNVNLTVSQLPFGAVNLDLSWNQLEYVPPLIGDHLRVLTVTNNPITTIDDHNFAKIAFLQILDLSENQIETISYNAFDDLLHLEKLDLSKNKLKYFQSNIFSSLTLMSELVLSFNNLTEAFSGGPTADQPNQHQVDLFLSLGVTPNLKVLEMNNCNLNRIDISNGGGLERIYLRFNNFSTVPDLPSSVEFLDLSGNPFEVLFPKFLPHLYKLKTLLLQDMPNLTHVEEYSLYGLPRLEQLNFQGSKRLESFHEHAFGQNVVLNETDTVLEVLNFHGTNLQTLNSSLKFALEVIKVLELDGNPLLCDCELKWIKTLEIETNGQCMKPSSIRGKLISDVPEQRFACQRWNTSMYKVMNGLFVLLLLILCGVAMYLIVIGIKPSRKNVLQKISSASPYARITSVSIDPNRAELQNA